MKTPSETLVNWLKAHELNQSQFATALGLHRSAVTLYVKGLRRPRRDIAALIEQHTGGKVPAAIWRSAA